MRTRDWLLFLHLAKFEKSKHWQEMIFTKKMLKLESMNGKLEALKQIFGAKTFNYHRADACL